MAFLSGRPNRKPEPGESEDRFLRSGIDSRVDGSVRVDIFNSPAFRAHIQSNHHGRNPFEERESSLEQAARELPGRFDDSENEAKREQEKVMLYGTDNKGPLYGTKEAGQESKLYGTGHSSSSGDHLTCCSLDFMKDGSVQPHQEEKSAGYAGAPGAATGYGTSKPATAASLYKK